MPVDPRTDRHHLRSESYADARRLEDRQQIYRFRVGPDLGPIAPWLFALAGGAAALPAPIVDVGAGNGQYVRALSDAGRDAIAIDLSAGMLRDARNAGWRGPCVVSDVQALPFPDRSVGTAMANHMLYHVPDVALGVRELRRVVDDDGVVFAVTNALDHVWELGELIETAVREISGDDAFTYDRSGTRFTLETGAGVLGTAFSRIERHDRRTTLRVPEPEPVLQYVASMRAMEELFPPGVRFDAVLEHARPRVEAAIARDGAFVVNVHAGAFVCRP